MNIAQELNAEERARSLVAIMVTITVAGTGFGLSSPLLSLAVDRAGHSGLLLGLFTAVPAISTLLFSPFVPGIMRRLGMIRTLFVLYAAMCAALLGFILTDNIWLWFLLRFLLGMAFTGQFVATEIWINLITPEETRGRTLGIYAAFLSGGFAIGAGILALVGEKAWMGILAAVTMFAFAGIPVLLARDVEPEAPPADGLSPVMPYIAAAPAAMMAALVFGAVETGILNLLPVFGERAGLTPAIAATMLMAAAAGNVACQWPIGIIADKMDRQTVLLWCAVSGTVAAVLIPLTLSTFWLLYPILFAFGGIIVGLYTVGLTRVGERFQGSKIAGANAAFITMYGAGALIGPPLSGVAMDIWNPTGLMVVLGLFCGIYAILVAWRARKRQSLTQDAL